MLLGSKFNMTTYEVIGSGEEMQFVNPVNSTVSLLELPLTYVIYLHLAIFAFLFILHLILFVLCGKYGDISPVVIRKKKDKKKKEDKQKKKDDIKEDSQAKSREPKMIFYDGPVPKSDNEIFIGLRDGDDIEVEPLSEIRKNVNTSKNVTPKEIKKEVEKVIPSPIKETPKKVENVQVTPKKVEPKPVSSKPVEQISFTSNYQKRADEIPFEDEDINIFTKKSDNESISTFSQSNTKFDFKNMCLDSHDEYYGNDDEDSEGIVGNLIVEEVPPEDAETSEIKGEIFIKPKVTYKYSYDKSDVGEWSIVEKVPVTLEVIDAHNVKLKWN